MTCSSCLVTIFLLEPHLSVMMRWTKFPNPLYTTGAQQEHVRDELFLSTPCVELNVALTRCWRDGTANDFDPLTHRPGCLSGVHVVKDLAIPLTWHYESLLCKHPFWQFCQLHYP